jgi:hypothetical protein
MTDKTEVVKMETEADKILASRKVKKEIHDLYEKWYGSGL